MPQKSNMATVMHQCLSKDMAMPSDLCFLAKATLVYMIKAQDFHKFPCQKIKKLCQTSPATA